MNNVVIDGVDYGLIVNVGGAFVHKFYADSMGLKYSPYEGEEFIGDIYVSAELPSGRSVRFYGSSIRSLESIARRLTHSGKYKATICTNCIIFQWWEHGSLARGTCELVGDYEKFAQ